MQVCLECPDCGHTWVISAEEITKEHGEEAANISLFGDICPICDSQGNVLDIPEESFV